MGHNRAKSDDSEETKALPAPTVADVFGSLLREHGQVVDNVAKGHYSFWLGSGISRRRAKTVPLFLKGLIEFLASRLEPEVDGPHRVALRDVLGIAGVGADDDRDLGNPLTWSDLEEVCEVLANQYSAVLDIDVDGFSGDYLLWEGIDVVAQYAGPMEPDVEHLAIAMLGVEGAAPILISANWDPLVERAYDLLFGSRTGLLKVEVHPDDFRPPSARTELVKFHGCATLAGANEARFRQLIIGRKSQISDWITDQSFRALRERLTGIVRDHPSLIAGLSAQDADIQAVFGTAADMNPWTWPSDAGAVVVSSPTLGLDQKQVLKQAYSSSYEANAREIQEDACLGHYPRFVFLALLLHVWRAKLSFALLEHGVEEMQLHRGIESWALGVAKSLDVDEVTDLLAPIAEVTRGIARFKRGKPNGALYEPLSIDGVPDAAGGGGGANDSNELRALSLAIGVLGSGEAAGHWSIISPILDVSSIHLELGGGIERNLQAFANDGAFAAALAEDELTGPLTLVVSNRASQRRSPQQTIGRTGRFVAEPFYLDPAEYSDDSVGAVHDALERYLVL